MMIVNNNSSSVTKRGSKLIDNARVVIYNRDIFIIQATGAEKMNSILV
jgi:hypothetical protein